jgi:hypothetical protein
MAMALFAGAMIRDRKMAFLLPLLSMLTSDVVYQFLYAQGLTTIKGFYSGQVVNYALILGVTAFGFLMKKVTALRVLGFSMAGSIIFFLTSNFAVWFGGGGLSRPKTFDGLMMCYYDGLAFLRDYGVVKGFIGNVFLGDLFFCTILFGSFALFTRVSRQQKTQLA